MHFPEIRAGSSRLRRSGSTTMLVVGAIAALAAIGIGSWFFLRDRGSTEEPPVLKEVTRGSFEAAVLDQGEVESSENVEFRCEVKGGTSIIWIIEEGRMVKGGDELIRLDSAQLEIDLQTQQVNVSNKESFVIQSKTVYDAAVVAKDEYIEGTFKQEEQTIQNEIFEAEENLRKAQQYLNYSEKLAARQFVTPLQLEADRFAVERSRNALDLATRKLDVLRNQTQKKMLIQLEGEIEKAKGTWENDVEILRVEEVKLQDIKDQIAKCLISVPEGVEGQVVHANKFSSRGGNAEWVAEEGASVRERQTIITLPNPSKMQVKAKVNESRVTSVVVGMPVEIKLDALQGTKLAGKVIKVNQYPEPEGWSGGGVKQYGVLVKIVNPPPATRPGMNASVSIIVDRREDAVQVPLQAVYEYKANTFCLVAKGEAYETRHIKVAGMNDTVAAIEEADGFDMLHAGEQVVMNPRRHKDKFELPELPDPPKPEFKPHEEPDGPSDEQPESSPGPSAGGPIAGGPAGGGLPSAADIVNRMLEADTNGDGKLSQDELAGVDERARDRLKEADTNGDGELDRRELDAAAQATVRMIKQRMSGSGGSFPSGGGQ